LVEKVRNNLSRIMNADDAGHCETWSIPAVKDGADDTPGAAIASRYMTADQLEKIQQQAYDEAFQQGLQQGRQQAQAELGQSVSSINSVLNSLAKPLQEVSEQVENELVDLCIAMLKQLVRRELKLDPGQVVAVVREALTALPGSSRNIQVRLNPADIAIVKQALGASEDAQGWRAIDDPVIARGGCRVTTETSNIDNTVDAKIAQLIAQVFGGQRVSDESGKQD